LHQIGKWSVGIDLWCGSASLQYRRFGWSTEIVLRSIRRVPPVLISED